MKQILSYKKRFSILLLAAGITSATLIVSCEKYLDVPIESQLPSDYTKELTPDEAFQYVSAAYGGMRKWGVSVFPYIGMFEVTSDDADKGSTADDSPTMLELDKFQFDANNDLIASYWNDHYSVISTCNYAITTLKKLKFTDTTARDQMVAEAKFIRAFMFLRMNIAYGGVPVVDTLQTVEGFATVARSTKEQVFAFIEKDLSEAIPFLPEAYSSDQVGRATNWAAKALLARTYMFEEKWPELKLITDEIIGLGPFSLYPNYYRLFRIEGESSFESVFEIQNSSMNQGKYRCEYAFVQGPRNNFAQMQGWGFCVPSQKLVDFFTSRGDNIRKAATVLPRGFRTAEGDSINAGCPNPYYNFKAYTPKKYNTVDYGLDQNIRYIRYAEVLLMNAEAALHAGGDAATPFNEVRKRAGLTELGSPTLQDVWDERRAEFAMEEFRFFDLVRTGQATAELGSLGYINGKNNLFPIPQTQIDLSNGVLLQNPGY
ncbi:RagB/SusD family nutrient uptake outer membrane protein [Williamwhitmania taraxaci]|uniref:SusD family protein n=1 Tax=Williamwhitmania taraxaci TaxID=1640674 RepID=A0A1G6MTS3_9BACT|nr:RagB/SusD family nutrient uptake outer membrane protein [Williamwhitmania taraxaci]SDC58821.1 SusD family protein [Williamwhitmania taraxaci]